MNDKQHDETKKRHEGVRSRMMSLLIGGALVYVGLLVLIFVFQGNLIFFPTRDVFVPPELRTWGYEDVTLDVDGETTHGWYIPAEQDTAGVILFSHGNAGNIADRADSIGIFHQLGYDVFIYDYGGYGNSSGSPSEDRCYADIRAAWTYLTEERGRGPEDIVLFGRSLGAGPTAQLATEVEARAVILESTFISIADMAGQQFPIFPTRLLVRHKFDNLAKVPRITAPILHIHSPHDELIPYEHGRRLFDASTEPKQFLEITGGHNEGYASSNTIYVSGLAAFLAELQ